MVKRHPNLVIVGAHPGEYDQMQRHIARAKMSDNYYIDISGTAIFRYGALKRLVDTVGADRLIYGSDFPTCNPEIFLSGLLCNRHLTAAEEANEAKNEAETSAEETAETADMDAKEAIRVVKTAEKIDFLTARFYVPEDLRIRAETRFDSKGSSWKWAILISAIAVIVAAVLCILVPDLVQFADNIMTWLAPK